MRSEIVIYCRKNFISAIFPPFADIWSNCCTNTNSDWYRTYIFHMYRFSSIIKQFLSSLVNSINLFFMHTGEIDGRKKINKQSCITCVHWNRDNSVSQFFFFMAAKSVSRMLSIVWHKVQEDKKMLLPSWIGQHRGRNRGVHSTIKTPISYRNALLFMC